MNGKRARATRAAGVRLEMPKRAVRKALKMRRQSQSATSRPSGPRVLPRLWNEKQQRYVEIMVPKQLKPQRR